MIFIVVKHQVRPESSDDFTELVGEFTRSTRAEPGNLWFEWFRSVDDPNEFVLLEAFHDGDAGAEHVNSDHFKAAMQRIPSMLVKVPEIVNVEVPGTQWSKLAEMSVD